MNEGTSDAKGSGPGKPGRTWEELYRSCGVVQEEPSSEASAAVDAFRRAGAQKVLDLGCGTGRHARVLFDNGFHVCGCDRSKEALFIAEQLVPEAAFEPAEMMALPYADDSFDAIFCYQVIQHARMADVQAAVKEMRRVLRARGMLFLRVPSTEHPEAATGKEIEPGTRLGIDAIDGDMPHHYFTCAELESLFGDFEILSLEHKHHASEKDHTRPAASWSLRCRLASKARPQKNGGNRV